MGVIRDRIKEPSTWAGIGLVLQACAQIYLTKGGDSTAFTTLGAGIAAIFLPESRAEEN